MLQKNKERLVIMTLAEVVVKHEWRRERLLYVDIACVGTSLHTEKCVRLSFLFVSHLLLLGTVRAHVEWFAQDDRWEASGTKVLDPFGSVDIGEFHLECKLPALRSQPMGADARSYEEAVEQDLPVSYTHLTLPTKA